MESSVQKKRVEWFDLHLLQLVHSSRGRGQRGESGVGRCTEGFDERPLLHGHSALVVI